MTDELNEEELIPEDSDTAVEEGNETGINDSEENDEVDETVEDSDEDDEDDETVEDSDEDETDDKDEI